MKTTSIYCLDANTSENLSQIGPCRPLMRLGPCCEPSCCRSVGSLLDSYERIKNEESLLSTSSDIISRPISDPVPHCPPKCRMVVKRHYLCVWNIFILILMLVWANEANQGTSKSIPSNFQLRPNSLHVKHNLIN
jgi:hypothetical protein